MAHLDSLGVTTPNVKNRTFRALRKPIAFLNPIAIDFCNLSCWVFDRLEDRCINDRLRTRTAGEIEVSQIPVQGRHDRTLTFLGNFYIGQDSPSI